MATFKFCGFWLWYPVWEQLRSSEAKVDICNVLAELSFSCPSRNMEEKANLKPALPADLKTEPWTEAWTMLYSTKAFMPWFPSPQKNFQCQIERTLQILHSEFMLLTRRRVKFHWFTQTTVLSSHSFGRWRMSRFTPSSANDALNTKIFWRSISLVSPQELNKKRREVKKETPPSLTSVWTEKCPGVTGRGTWKWIPVKKALLKLIWKCCL